MMHEMVDLDAVASEELAKAQTSPHGRSARALLHDGALRHTLLAILDGRALADHAKPASATIYALRGAFVVRSGAAEVRVEAGQLAVLPGPRHDVTAAGDAVGILTTVVG